RSKYPRDNLTFCCGPAEEIPVPGQHVFDVVVSFETIEHLTADAQARFLAEIKRLLRPDGLLLISTPNRLTYNDGEQHHNPYHLQEFSAEEFAAFLDPRFRFTRLLRQRVFPSCYIWDAAEPSGRCSEYQLEVRDGQFQPTLADGKEELYLIALCSDAPLAAPGNSLLLDLAGRRLTSTLYLDP